MRDIWNPPDYDCGIRHGTEHIMRHAAEVGAVIVDGDKALVGVLLRVRVHVRVAFVMQRRRRISIWAALIRLCAAPYGAA